MTDLEREQRGAVVKEALSWQGTDYRHMGRVKGAGTDCGMLILQTFENRGLIPHIEIPYYPPDIACHTDCTDYLNWIKKYAMQVEREPVAGDILLYHFPGARVPHHAAIIIDNEYIIHSYSRQGVVLANRRGYQKYEVGLFSYWG